MMTWGEAAGRLRSDLAAARRALDEGIWTGGDDAPVFTLPEDPPDDATAAELVELIAEARAMAAEIEVRRAEIRAELQRMGRVRGAGRAYLRHQPALGEIA